MPQVFPTVSISTQKGNNWSLSYKLANFYADERDLWKQIGKNVDATLKEDIRKCVESKEKLAKESLP